MLKTVNLTKRYEDGILALDNLNLHIKPGEIFCLLGANGAGKTTAVNLFFNFIPPTSGTAYVNEIDVTKNPLEAKKYVSFVSENVMLYQNFTARQNLDFFAKLGGRRDLDKDGYYKIMREVSLPEKSFEKKLKDFSKGMRQKLGIAIAITKNAPAMILDEPTSGLDPKAGNEFLDILKKQKEKNTAILMVTHDIFRAKVIGDRIGIMKEGRLVMTESNADLKHENLEEIYLKYMQQ